jgi:hypothetical protein
MQHLGRHQRRGNAKLHLEIGCLEFESGICKCTPAVESSFVMPGLVPGIHVLSSLPQERGWPGQARP